MKHLCKVILLCKVIVLCYTTSLQLYALRHPLAARTLPGRYAKIGVAVLVIVVTVTVFGNHALGAFYYLDPVGTPPPQSYHSSALFCLEVCILTVFAGCDIV